MAIQEFCYFSEVGMFTIFCSASSDNFFVVIYIFLSLFLTIDFCYSQLIIFYILFKENKKIK